MPRGCSPTCFLSERQHGSYLLLYQQAEFASTANLDTSETKGSRQTSQQEDPLESMTEIDRAEVNDSPQEEVESRRLLAKIVQTAPKIIFQ